MDAKTMGQQLAYPMGEQDHKDFEETGWGGAGLTKRELFAAMAMSGLSANPCPQVSTWDAEKTAACAVSFADALLQELAKDNE